MAKTITIKVEGLQELERRLKAFGPKIVRNGLRTSAYAGAKVMMNAVKETAPVRTGELRANIRAFKRRGQPNEARYSVGVRGLTRKFGNTPQNRRLRRVGKKYRVDGPGFYARFVEFGTSKMAARPFMRPAFLANTDRAIAAVKARLERAVELAAKK
jgi:HK97 gp10 family phage protein